MKIKTRRLLSAFTTAVTVPSPFMVHTTKGWDEIKEKIKNYDWAKEALAEY